MALYQVIEVATGRKVNRVVWDGKAPWSPGAGFRVEPDDGSPIAAVPASSLPPDNPTLGDWRVGLALWGRLADVTSKVQALVAVGNPLGVVAQQRLEYSNNVLRDQLMALKDAFGFTAAEIDESLWRAAQVAQGDLSGVWPPKSR